MLYGTDTACQVTRITGLVVYYNQIVSFARSRVALCYRLGMDRFGSGSPIKPLALRFSRLSDRTLSVSHVIRETKPGELYALLFIGDGVFYLKILFAYSV